MRAATVPPGMTAPPAKPEGGYQFMPAVRLALAWWAYHEKLIRLVDLRVWFAAWEMRARRCRTPLPRRFGLGELQRLTGLSVRRLKASLRRLEAAGLLVWSESAIGFPASIEGVPLSDRDGFRHFLDGIPNHRRLVPVPRRILRLLAGGARPALIATILGHLFRCLYAKGGKCLSVGRVKASWIADTFGIALRRVKQARRELIALGWLIPLDSPQWALNRWGALIRINLDWSRTGGLRPAAGAAAVAEPGDDGALAPPPAPAPGPELAPPPPDSGPELAPPDSDEEPLTGAKDQEPAAGGPAGFSVDRPGGKTPGAEGRPRGVAPMSRPAAAGEPDLRHVVAEDLADTGRLLELYAQAVALGLVPASEWGRLRFVAAAEHARDIGTANPCGLFAALVRGRRLHFATEGDAQAASVRLRQHLYGGPAPRRPPAREIGVRREPESSEDARLVEAVRAAAARAGYRGDPFPLLKREKPEWTRERWDQALEELGR